MEKEKNYQEYQAEDFAADASFRAYVLSSDEADMRFWESWLAQYPEKEETIREAIGILDLIFSRLPKDEFETSVNKFAKQVQPKGRVKPLYGAGHGKSFDWRRRAAIITLLLMAAIGTYFLSDPLPATVETQEKLAEVLVTKATPRGQKSTIALKDGTLVRLNAESQITFPENFNDSVRVISLEGEAYFEVTHNAEKPFIVKCGDLYTEVLGTSFNVNAYPEAGHIQVALVEGSVKVYQENASENLILEPSEIASFDKQKQQMSKSEFDPDLVLGWKNGVIIFRKASFDEIERVLERWYDVNFVYKQKPSMEGFTGEFKNQSLAAVMDGISFSVGFDYKIEGENVTIIP